MSIKRIAKCFFMTILIVLLSFSLNACKKVNETLDLYCLHEFKGRILEKGNEPGISKITGFLNDEKTNYSDQIILNTGDMFQDTYDSGMNRGNLLAEVLPEMGCEAMSVGNHEFDWGLDAYKKNRKLAKGTSFLGANVYHYDKDNKRVLNYASDLCEPYKIVERSGRKIGIIGIVGVNEITAITSEIVDDLVFVDPLDIVLSLAEKLKAKEKCSAVVLLAHASFEELGMTFCNSITQKCYKTSKRFVDAVFTGQTAKPEENIVNDVVFLQSEPRGREVSRITLDFSNGEPKTLGYARHIIIPTGMSQSIEVNRIVYRYINDEFINNKEFEIGRITGIREIPKQDVGRILALLTYDTLPIEHKDVDIVINNGSRKSIYPLPEGGVTPEMIFDALPYTNKTYVALVKGSDIKNLLKAHPYFAYYAPKKITLEAEKLYKVAAIDYVLFHKDINRDYDNFPSYTGKYLYKIDKYSYELFEEYLYNHPLINYTTAIFKCPCFSNITNVR